MRGHFQETTLSFWSISVKVELSRNHIFLPQAETARSIIIIDTRGNTMPGWYISINANRSIVLNRFLISSFSAHKIRKRKIFLTCTTREERLSVGSPLFDLRVKPTSTTRCKKEPAFCSERRHTFSLTVLLLQRGFYAEDEDAMARMLRVCRHNHTVWSLQSFIVMAAVKSATSTLHMLFFRNN